MLQATLSGNIGGDPEMRYTADAKALLRFNVAHNYSERNPQGETEKRVEWLRCTIIGPRAESLNQYLKKGARVTVVGQLKARPWTDQQGGLRAGMEILVSEIDFSSTGDGNGQQDRPSGQPARPRQAAANVPGSALPF
jgi:single-strand DNA-binding protein